MSSGTQWCMQQPWWVAVKGLLDQGWVVSLHLPEPPPIEVMDPARATSGVHAVVVMRRQGGALVVSGCEGAARAGALHINANPLPARLTRRWVAATLDHIASGGDDEAADLPEIPHRYSTPTVGEA